MTLKKLFSLLILLMGCFAISAQKISGIVADIQTQQPLEGVNIYLKKGNIGTVSQTNGIWVLENFKTMDSIYFRFLGYHTASFGIENFLDKQKDTIFLTPKEEQLSEVKVTAHKKIREKIIAQKLSPMPYGLIGFGSAIMDGKIYVIGGDQSFKSDNFKRVLNDAAQGMTSQYSSLLFSIGDISLDLYSNKLLIYDLTLDSWLKSATKFSKRAYHTIVPHKDNIYIIGGRTLSTNGVFEYLANTIEVYNIKKDTTIIDYINPHEASNPLGIIYNNDILIIGGSTKLLKKGKLKYAEKIHFYNIPSGQWYELGNLPKGMETDGAVLDNKLYIASKNSDKNGSSLYQFSLISGKWKKFNSVNLSIESPKFAQGNGIIYMYQKGFLFTYNPKSRELKKYSVNIEVENPKVHFYNEMIYILGGTIKQEFSARPSPDLYSISTHDFLFTKPVATENL